MPSLSNYPPGVTGNEPQITGELEPYPTPEDIEADAAALAPYGSSDDHGLVCQGCGEGFNNLDVAAHHLQESEDENCEDALFRILPIEEVF